MTAHCIDEGSVRSRPEKAEIVPLRRDALTIDDLIQVPRRGDRVDLVPGRPLPARIGKARLVQALAPIGRDRPAT